MEALSLITSGIWAIVGFIFWIPLVTRATVSLSVAVLYCTVTESNPEPTKKAYESAVGFYARGFVIIKQIFSGENNNSPTKPTGSKNTDSKWWQVFIEMIWTTMFWGTIFISISSLFGYSFFGNLYESYSSTKSVESYMKIGNDLYKQEKYDLALNEFSSVIKLSPYTSQAYFLRGLCYYKLKNYDSAIADYNEYIKFEADSATGYRNRSVFYELKGDKISAKKDAEKYVELAPQNEQQEAKDMLQRLNQ